MFSCKEERPMNVAYTMFCAQTLQLLQEKIWHLYVHTFEKQNQKLQQQIQSIRYYYKTTYFCETFSCPPPSIVVSIERMHSL